MLFNLDCIYRKGPNSAQPQNGRTLVIRENEVFDKIISIHNRLQHPGYKITHQALKEQFYGISREDVEWIIKHCILCAQNSANNSQAPLQPVQSTCILDRVQIDLVDMRATPDGNYKWILHLKDHFSKFTTLYPLADKTAESVATQIAHWIGMCGVPCKLQCDNGTEFKGVLLILLQRYGIKIINGRPRHLQTQGLVEQANGIMKKKLKI